MLHLAMRPGAVIPAHLHKNVAEVLYVVEGDFTNEGKRYEAGTTLHIKAGMPHGPHTTQEGRKLLVLWTERTSHEAADLSDFIVATKTASWRRFSRRRIRATEEGARSPGRGRSGADLTSPGAGRNAGEFAEDAGEMALVGKAARERDVCQ